MARYTGAMRGFAEILDRLILSPARSAKTAALADYFAHTPDPDRGYALAAVAGALSFKHAKGGLLRSLVEARVDPTLFALSYDYVGDLAETVALIWPPRHGANRAPSLSEVVEGLTAAKRSEAGALIEAWLDALPATERWALLKLITGGLRIGAGARLAKQALADWSGHPIEDIEDVWHSQAPPYSALFAWAEGRGPKPIVSEMARFRPVMLAHPLESSDMERLPAASFAAEWKWDGIRVQAALEYGAKRLFTRTAEDISATFPDVLAGLSFNGVIDGELLVRGPGGEVAAFNDLQQRLNRKTVDAKLLAKYPAFIRAYDLLAEDGEDLRGLTFRDRRGRLAAFVARHEGERLDLSPVFEAETWEELAAQRTAPPAAAVEGLMLKHWESRYEQGRPKGLWFKWKRDAHLVDCVLMYAQRGHGKRSSFYSDFTFGVWRDGALTPVGKAYFGFTDEELKQLDRFVRDKTTERFGPVRAVEQSLVLEIAFEGLQRSTRHKSGVAMRFPRINRIRWDKPAAEADTLAGLELLLPR
jgi:DNA ligase-1